MALVTLVSSDKQEFQVTKKVASCSVLIRKMLELEIGEGQPEEAIPLQEVGGDVLRQILEWCEHHQDDLPFNRHDPVVLDEWDQQFFENVDRVRLGQLLRAANYLDVERMTAYLCEVFARMVQGRNPMALRNLLGLENMPNPNNPAN